MNPLLPRKILPSKIGLQHVLLNEHLGSKVKLRLVDVGGDAAPALGELTYVGTPMTRP